VRLNLNGLAAVRSAYQEILEDVKRKRPDAVINGVAIEPMIVKPYGRELMVGAFRDPIFGPVITFGEGGAHVEIQADRAVALPPLNNYLVQDLIKSTRIATLLGEYRNMPPINMESLEFVLLRISEMVCELPWIREIDINPLIVDENGAVAVDARIIVDNIAPTADRYDHMAIHPYPSHLITKLSMPEGEITVRPIKPEDAELEIEFVRKLSPETKYLRFMNTMRELPPRWSPASPRSTTTARWPSSPPCPTKTATRSRSACAATRSTPTARPASSPSSWPKTGSTAASPAG
jgi:acetyltransferase